MTLFPRSLIWRSFLLIALLLICGELLAISLIRFNERVPRARQIAQQAVSIVNLSRTALIAAPRENRRYLLSELLRQEGMRIYPGDADEEPGRAPLRPFARLVAREIETRLGPGTRVEVGRRGIPGLWVGFNIDGDRYWVSLPRIPVDRRIPTRLMLWTAASLILALIGAWFTARHLNRPLKALAGAARRIGQGGPVVPLPEEGPQETREVIQSFNRMGQDLARLNEERTVMLAGISHDLRTPLARLRLAIELQEGKIDAAQQAGMVQDIADLDAIIEQFLAFARGLASETPQPTELNQLLTEIAERYARAGKPLHLTLGALPALPLRPLAMQRLVTNLIDNALRHGGADVALRTQRQGASVQLSVLDRGPGIAPSQTAQAFQPFQRLDAARSGHAGAGLGLAIVEQIARLHGGTIELLAREDGGLEARLTLPI